MALTSLLKDISACRICADFCPAGCRPLLQIGRKARIIIIGQAPGRRAHEAGVPWQDPSGDRLRDWLGIDRDIFYNRQHIAIMPMGFCYPGTGKSGDLPPRPECAPQWHERLLAEMPGLACTILLGRYAMDRYASDIQGKTLADRIQAIHRLDDGRILLPHPSPRNQRWFKQHPWFAETIVPTLQDKIAKLI